MQSKKLHDILESLLNLYFTQNFFSIYGTYSASANLHLGLLQVLLEYSEMPSAFTTLTAHPLTYTSWLLQCTVRVLWNACCILYQSLNSWLPMSVCSAIPVQQSMHFAALQNILMHCRSVQCTWSTDCRYPANILQRYCWRTWELSLVGCWLMFYCIGEISALIL